MISTLLERAGDLFERRFWVGYGFPTFFAALLWLLPRVLVYGPAATWRWWTGLGDEGGLLSPQAVVLLGSLFLITLIAYLLQAFTRPLVRLAEGYWPAWLQRWSLSYVKRRWEALRRKRREALRAGEQATYARLQEKLYYGYPPRAEWLLPTALGNTLRAAEVYARQAYGMDAPFWWPRLYPRLPQAEQARIEDALTMMIALLNLAVLLLYVALDTAIYLSRCRWPAWFISFLSCPIRDRAIYPILCHRLVWIVAAFAAGLLLAWLAWRGAVIQARSYGQRIRTAIDLHRFEVLEALRLPLPQTPQEERALWGKLEAWLYNYDLGEAMTLRYVHPDE